MIKLPLFSALLFGKLEQRASKPFAYNHWLFFVSNKPLPLLSHPHGISVTVLKSHEKMRTFACFYSKHLSHSIHYFHIRHKFAALKHIFLALGHFFFFFPGDCLHNLPSPSKQTLYDICSTRSEKVKLCRVWTAQNLLEPRWNLVRSPCLQHELNIFWIPSFPQTACWTVCSLSDYAFLRGRWTNGFFQSSEHFLLQIAEMLPKVIGKPLCIRHENICWEVLNWLLTGKWWEVKKSHWTLQKAISVIPLLSTAPFLPSFQTQTHTVTTGVMA